MTARLLWVDEDLDLLSDVRLALSECGLDITRRYTVGEALADAAEFIRRPDGIVLLDLICPLGPLQQFGGYSIEKLQLKALGGWYGIAVLLLFPELAERTVILSIVDSRRVERGLERLGIPVPAAILSKIDMYRGIQSLRGAIQTLVHSDRLDCAGTGTEPGRE